jgi:hypothetical protein
LEVTVEKYENEADIDPETMKAVKLLGENGYMVVSLKAPYIRELATLLEAAGYRVDEAKTERDEHGERTGRVLLAVFPFGAKPE